MDENDNLQNTISSVLKSVLKNKYIVKIFDEFNKNQDTNNWNVSELITYLTSSNIVEIHLFKTENLTDLSLNKKE